MCSSKLCSQARQLSFLYILTTDEFETLQGEHQQEGAATVNC